MLEAHLLCGVIQGCQPWRFPAAGKDLWQISSKSRTFQRPSFTGSVYSPRAWHIYKITGLSPQPQCNRTAGMRAVSLALLESTGFTKHVHSDQSMCVHHFHSENVSGPCKNIHRLQPLARQLTGPLIIPGLPLRESRLICPTMLKYLHFEKDRIIFSTHWTVLSYLCWAIPGRTITNHQWENRWFLRGTDLHPRAFYRHNPGLNHTTAEMCLYSE